MASTLTLEHTFDCPAPELLTLLMDDAFDALLLEHLEITWETLADEVRDDGTRRVRTRQAPKSDMPGFMKKLAGGRNSFIEERVWDRAYQGNRWTIEPGFAAGRVDVGGTFRVLPRADGCVRLLEGSFSVKVPLVGKKIEQFIIGQTTDTFERSARFIADYIAEHGTTPP